MDSESKDWLVRGYHNSQKGEIARQMRRAMTPQERILWEAVRKNRCGGLHFRREQVIDGFIADFYCHAKGLVIKVDGGIHEWQQVEDARRTAVFAQRGLRVMRFSNERITNDLRTCLDEMQTFENRHDA